MIPRPLRFTLFPYTTLFRSCEEDKKALATFFNENENNKEEYKEIIGKGKVIHVDNSPTNFNDHDRKSTRLNSSHMSISYAVFCLKKKNNINYTHLSNLCKNS